MNDPTLDSELLLSAFRYTSAEMSDEEQRQFEDRLAVDQGAREAVARSVAIAQSVVSVPVEVSKIECPVRPCWRRRIAWTSLAAAAVCAAFAVGWSFASRSNTVPADSIAVDGEAENVEPGRIASQDTEPLSVPGPGALELVSYWLQGTDGTEREAARGERYWLGASEAVVADSELTVPDWMLSAVSAEAAPAILPVDGGVMEN